VLGYVSRNLLANTVGTVWTAILALAVIPFYVYYLGIEEYGLVGFFLILLTVGSLVDLGLSTALNRDFARAVPAGQSGGRHLDLLVTLEHVYWLLALTGGLTVFLLAPVISAHWLESTMAVDRTTQSIRLMGVALILHLPYALYSGGLLGLQRHTTLNAVLVGSSTFRWIGALLILMVVSPTIEAFFIWQIIAAIAHTGTARIALKRALPKPIEKPTFRRDLLTSIGPFALGVGGITLLSTLLTQVDKIVLSRMITLTEFGYYMIATAVGSGVAMIAAPFFATMLPRFSELMVREDGRTLATTYHTSAQLLSTLVFSAMFIIVLHVEEILILWTRNPDIALHGALVTRLLVIGSALSATAYMPYALQLASGWTRLPLSLTAVAVVFLVPSAIAAGYWYGAAGVASIWIIVNALYLSVGAGIMHRRLLEQERWKYYVVDLFLPLLISVSVVWAISLISDFDALRSALLWLPVTAGTAVVSTLFVLPDTRRLMLDLLRQSQSKYRQSAGDGRGK
jgi:O-antigen/teichoic acid export membrane protein